MALLVQKFYGEFFCQNAFPAILRLKKGLSGRATNMRTFFAAFLTASDLRSNYLKEKGQSFC